MEKTIRFTEFCGVTKVEVATLLSESIVMTSFSTEEIGKITPASAHKDFHESATGFVAEITSATFTKGYLFQQGRFNTFAEAVGHIVAHSGALTE